MKLIYELCTSVKTGIVLMVLLFIYCSVGSSGVPISLDALGADYLVPVA